MTRHLLVFVGLVVVVIVGVASRYADVGMAARLVFLSVLATAYVVAAALAFMQARALPAVVKTLLIVAFLLSAGFTIALGLDASAHAAAGW